MPLGATFFGFVYLLKCGEHYKIGFSKKPRKRVKQFRTGSPYPVELIHMFRTIHYRNIEQQLHDRFAARRVRGEWFKLDDAHIEYIKSLNSSGRTPEEQAERERSDAEYHAAQRAQEDAAYTAQMNQLLTGLVGL